MTRILAWCVVVTSLCVAASAGVNPGSISGYVRNSAGVPQMGATVSLVGTAGQPQLAYTDAKGFFSLAGLLPGSYDLHVSAPSFLPTLREDVALAAGASKVLNITLNTLFEAVRMLPPLKKGDDEDDSWKWTLRSTANRPVLRFDGGLRHGGGDRIRRSDPEADRWRSWPAPPMKATAAHPIWERLSTLSSRSSTLERWELHGDLGYGSGAPDGVVRASYRA